MALKQMTLATQSANAARRRLSTVLADFAFRHGRQSHLPVVELAELADGRKVRLRALRHAFRAPRAFPPFRAEIQLRIPLGRSASFRQFLLNYRIAMARDFLAEPQACVSEVAYAVGFNNPSHFARIFHRFVGEPPTRYSQHVGRPEQVPGGANRANRTRSSY